MMTNQKKWLPVALLVSMFSTGCIIVDRDIDWEYDGSSSWKERERDNRQKIADLNLGISIDEIRNNLGNPDFSEGFESDGRDYVVLRYRTHHRHSDGETTTDETTPLVFENGGLIGWGESAVRRLL